MPAQIDIKEVHWLLDIVQCIDVGVIVLDRQYQVEVWNSFMEGIFNIKCFFDHSRKMMFVD